ncbi:MAG: c-type cytochrome [Terriglobales bacterium]
MKRAWLSACIVLAAASLWAGERKPEPSEPSTTVAAVARPLQHELDRLEGEKRFRTNCGRCHQPPHKYPPRMMATFIRHMRVRATITDEDMRFILAYMTQ